MARATIATATTTATMCACTGTMHTDMTMIVCYLGHTCMWERTDDWFRMEQEGRKMTRVERTNTWQKNGPLSDHHWHVKCGGVFFEDKRLQVIIVMPSCSNLDAYPRINTHIPCKKPNGKYVETNWGEKKTPHFVSKFRGYTKSKCHPKDINCAAFSRKMLDTLHLRSFAIDS